MPIYEYQCQCGERRTELRPISQCKEPLIAPCKSKEYEFGDDEKKCEFKRVMSATPTTFRFNDRTGFKGLDKRRDR